MIIRQHKKVYIKVVGESARKVKWNSGADSIPRRVDIASVDLAFSQPMKNNQQTMQVVTHMHSLKQQIN